VATAGQSADKQQKQNANGENKCVRIDEMATVMIWTITVPVISVDTLALDYIEVLTFL